MNHDFFGNEDEYEYTNEVHMSNDEILKFLSTDEVTVDEENIYTKIRTTNGLDFNELKSDMSDILGNGMVMKSLKKEGVGEKMQENTQVSVRYYGFFENQKEPFDASKDRGSKCDVLFLGQGALIPGLEIALLSMKKFEISMFLIKPEYAYGLLGCPPRIPENQEVLFLIHLMDFNDKDFDAGFQHLSIEDKKLFCNVARKVEIQIGKASEQFRKGKIKIAITQYTKAANMLEMASLADENEEIEQKKLLTRVYNNLLICFNRENKARPACTAFNQIPNRSAKSYFNHARALTRLGEFQRAIEELHKSKKMDPRSSEIVEELNLIKELNLKYTSIIKTLKANCFLITGAGEVSSTFKCTAKDLCSALNNDSKVSRIILPSGLTIDEINSIQNIVVSFNLIVVNHLRFEKEVVFIAKSNY